jgi:hypothetical protein
VRMLLLHPEDSPHREPWAQVRWDLIVDLGISSEFQVRSWEGELKCPIVSLGSFRHGLEDPKIASKILKSGQGCLLGEHELDWWELMALLIHEELETALLVSRLCQALPHADEIHATRSGWPVSALVAGLKREVKAFGQNADTRASGHLSRYWNVFRKFSWSQLGEIFMDKYDAGYEWRSRFGVHASRRSKPVVLVPTAYTNVSRMAADYARMLPDQEFLFVTTRRSAARFECPANVRLASLSAYASSSQRDREYSQLLEKWKTLEEKLSLIPEMAVLISSERLDFVPDVLRHGLAMRDAWRGVFAREQVTSVLCGDDSNRYTRVPVILGRRLGIPTVDFHHGAFDGRFLLKTLPADLFLAKSEMERDYLVQVCEMAPEKIALGAPRLQHYSDTPEREKGEFSHIVFFSEAYETSNARPEDIYRELLTPVLRLARKSNMKVLIKLHPFESAKEREWLVQRVFAPEDGDLIQIVEGPLSPDILLNAWFAITVESTAALDCTLRNVPCFVCEWLVLSSYGYVQQYARFGVGIMLKSPQEIESIPDILAKGMNQAVRKDYLWQPIEPSMLQMYLSRSASQGGDQEQPKERKAN